MDDISVLNLFLDAGMVVKTVMIILLIASLLTWIVIVERYNFYKKIKLINDSFLDRFWSGEDLNTLYSCLLYTSPSPRDKRQSRMPSSA